MNVTVRKIPKFPVMKIVSTVRSNELFESNEDYFITVANISSLFQAVVAIFL